MLDWTLRAKLTAAFLAVVVTSAVLTIIAGTYLFKTMVMREARRRVELDLRAARATYDHELRESERLAWTLAEIPPRASSPAAFLHQESLASVRDRFGLDWLQFCDPEGRIVLSASGNGIGTQAPGAKVAGVALQERRPVSGTELIPIERLALQSSELGKQAYVQIQPTPRAKPGGPTELRDGMCLVAAAPVIGADERLLGAILGGKLLNRNYELVDDIRDTVFPTEVLHGKSLGTVTVFQGDVRVATNVTDRQGRRAIGTRVSEEVYDRVLGQGLPWLGNAFVVDTWYVSAYEPIEDVNGQIVGMLYVGVLKDWYTSIERKIVLTFVLVGVLAVVAGAVISTWLAVRLTGPIRRLTDGAEAISRGDLQYRLSEPRSAHRDSVKKLTVAFNRMAEALQERQQALERSNQELQRWNQNYLNTLEFITHELKNQLAAMKLNLFAVRDGYIGEITPDQREALVDVATALNRTDEMIRNYLNLSRIEKGELEVRLRQVSVEHDVVRPVLRERTGEFKDKGMTVQIELPPGLVVQADADLLQVVYENLLGNAVKYGHAGGTVRVGGEVKEASCELWVWNEGEGVPRDKLGEIFRKFARGPDGDVEQARGSGLGLFITKSIVERHGGQIRAESEPGQWMSFVFTLPCAAAPAGDLPESEERIGAPPAADAGE
jgi:two-component system NtrC family sensor kinase